jgi:energy-coupling factor transporter transmembrane protein EcfT
VTLVAGVATVNPGSPAIRIAVPALALFVLSLTRPDRRVLARRTLVAFGAILAVCLPFVLVGDFVRALELGGRAAAATLIALAFAATLPLEELPGALRALGLPADFASTVHGMLWQLGNIRAEGRRLVLARKLRGARGVVGPEILAELLVRTTARAERVDLAMQLRGAHSALAARRVGLGARDFVGIAIALAVGIGLHVLARAS